MNFLRRISKIKTAKANTKIISAVISIFILGVLVLSGPANALQLSLTADNSEVEQGKKITFTASVDIESGESLPISEIILILDGAEYVECSFDITGKMKSGVNDECHGINIKKIPYPKIEYGYGYHGEGYGYGYGYTEQTLTYEITLHSQKFLPGEYETRLDVVANGNTFSESGPYITILEKQKGNEQENENKENNGNHNGNVNNENVNEGNNENNANENHESNSNEADTGDNNEQENENKENNGNHNGNVNGNSNSGSDNNSNNSGGNSNSNPNSNSGNGKGKNK